MQSIRRLLHDRSTLRAKPRRQTILRGTRAALLMLACAFSTHAMAAACTEQDLTNAVDQSGAKLREFSLKAQPPLQQRMRRFAELANMPGEAPEDAALDAIKDATLDSLDEKSATLLLKVDSLGRARSTAPLDCAKVDEIGAATAELLSVMKAKSDYMLSRLDAKIAEAEEKPANDKPAATAANDPAQPAAKPAPKETKPSPPVVAERSPPSPDSKTPTRETPKREPADTAWTSKTQPNDSYRPPAADQGNPQSNTLPPVAITSPPNLDTEGYTVDEIREATRGFFGTVSTSLASVIEHAFKTSGRPTAYVLGWEGGGAFLAGLRFGKGTLYMRNATATRTVHWHGPSVGTDFGASGSRTMFLIYRMREPEGLYRSFTGVDGSAYFVGGVGLTLLKGGDVIMAPIRSGLGLRVGANVGYVRFTDGPTWNPF